MVGGGPHRTWSLERDESSVPMVLAAPKGPHKILVVTAFTLHSQKLLTMAKNIRHGTDAHRTWSLKRIKSGNLTSVMSRHCSLFEASAVS